MIGMKRLALTGDPTHSKMNRIIFVVGGIHSGTTLMATILGSNSRCWLITSETGAYSLRHIKNIRSLFVKKVKTLEAEMVVEKTPSHVFNIDKIQEDFPEAKIVIMARNPVDSVASTFKVHGDFNKAVYDCSNDLSGCISATAYDNTNLVFYEDLVKNFDLTVKKLCNKIELNYEESMKNFHNNDFAWFEGFIEESDFFKRRSLQMKMPLFDDSGKGYKELTENQISQINFDCMGKYELLRSLDKNISR